METLRDAGAETEGRDPLAGSGSGGGCMLLGATDGVGNTVVGDASADLSKINAGLAGLPWGRPSMCAVLPSSRRDGAWAFVAAGSMFEERVAVYASR